MDREALARAIEAIVMVADRPIETSLLAQLLEVPATEVEEICQEVAAGYEVDGRGFILTRVAGGWRYQSHPDLAPYVERYVLEGQSARLSAAALETLAIVAYKQPISRAQVAAIRGVNVDGVMRTLEQRGYIAEVGRDPGPGQAVLFGTSDVFLEKLGLDSLAQLPPLSEFVPGADVVEALENGLRPPPDELIRAGSVTAADQPADEPADVGPSAGAEDVDDDAGHGAATVDAEAVPAGDPLARLDETTARLDALVDEVRGRIEAAEAAVAEQDGTEQDGTEQDGTDQDDAGTEDTDEPGEAGTEQRADTRPEVQPTADAG